MPARRLNGLGWELIKEAVDEVTAQAGVSTEAVNGAVSDLFVEGAWGAVAAPGFAWCSLAAADDAALCSKIIRAAMRLRF